MWGLRLQNTLGLFVTLLIHLTLSLDYDCDHELWDEVTQGRLVKNLEFSCTSGRVTWHAPYGGLFIEIKGPLKEHKLCIKAESIHTSALISSIGNNGRPKRLFTIEETPKNGRQHTHSMCFPAYGSTLLFMEPATGAFVSAKIILDYDVDLNPKYGEDACSPCTDEELLYNYCSSDFVAIGHVTAIDSSPAANRLSVKIDMLKQQSSKYFKKHQEADKYYTGKLYTPSHCKMEHSNDKFVFMGKIKFNRAELVCAPTYEDFADLQKRSKLKGTTLCS
ncbi:meteorin-like protein [Watersipora subatra]|uniref:meteorin-like protein n=1 Tax=Watersipora subatra TaxID=2589382 RepID=UPI00355AF143